MEKQKAKLVVVAVAFTLLLAGAMTFYMWGGRSGSRDGRILRILAYSSFVSSWGPGPLIAKKFTEKTGIQVQLHDGEDAGLLLKKLQLFPSDVVIGLDGFAFDEARRTYRWRVINDPLEPGVLRDFVPFDWAPLAFNYRRDEMDPPKSLDDLLDPRFKNAIALQDPRTSSPGLQFLLWVLDVKGVDEGFAFLAKLKPNIHTMASSWSTAYGLFQQKQAKLVFSYLTSPIYHLLNEKSENFAAAPFVEGHPVQVEYLGIPENCVSCSAAEEFVRFIFEPEIQKIIMETNFMLPSRRGVEQGTPFAKLPTVKVRDHSSAEELLKNREALLELWQKLGL